MLLVRRVQEKLQAEKDYFQNTFAHRTEYLLSRLVICDFCGHHYVDTATKSGKHHYYSCSTYLRRGRKACGASLLNKDKFERAVLDQVQAQVLSDENVRKYLAFVLEGVQKAAPEISAEETTVERAIHTVEAKIRRWEETLQKRTSITQGMCRSHQRASRPTRGSSEPKGGFTEKLAATSEGITNTDRLDGSIYPRGPATASPKKIGYKKEFLREILKEVRVRGSEVRLSTSCP